MSSEIVVKTKEKVSKSGFYVYLDHETDTSGCTITSKAKTGLYLAEGSQAPSLGSCPHEVAWKLIRSESR